MENKPDESHSHSTNSTNSSHSSKSSDDSSDDWKIVKTKTKSRTSRKSHSHSHSSHSSHSSHRSSSTKKKSSISKHSSDYSDYSDYMETEFVDIMREFSRKDPESEEMISRLIAEKKAKVTNFRFSKEQKNQEFEEVCKYYGVDYEKNEETGDIVCDEWYIVSVEARDYIRDKMCILAGLKPFHSNLLCGPIIINKHVLEETPPIIEIDHNIPIPLENHIALVSSYSNDGVWTDTVVNVMTTVQEYWRVINWCASRDSGCCFHHALRDKQEEAHELFGKLLEISKQGKTYRDKNVISGYINKYNSCHPIWSFRKVSKSVTNENKDLLPDSFIRDKKGCSMNDINMNLKTSQELERRKLFIMNDEYTKGIIPMILLCFVGECLHDDIRHIVFSKTIANDRGHYFLGSRLRLCAKNAKRETVMGIQEFIENSFIKSISDDKHDYSECIVNVTSYFKN